MSHHHRVVVAEPADKPFALINTLYCPLYAMILISAFCVSIVSTICSSSGKIISKRKPQAVALDEIQDINGWELFVNGLLNRGYAVFVTGSNARMHSRELGTKLTGRHLDLHLQPFSYSEFVRFKSYESNGESLDEYLLTGGFPAYVASGNRQVLVELFNDIIYRDIVVCYNLANTALIHGSSSMPLPRQRQIDTHMFIVYKQWTSSTIVFL